MFENLSPKIETEKNKPLTLEDLRQLKRKEIAAISPDELPEGKEDKTALFLKSYNKIMEFLTEEAAKEYIEKKILEDNKNKVAREYQ